MSTTSLLSRAIQVIDAVSKSDNGLRFSDIAAVLGQPSPATVNKILKELIRETVLEKTAAGRYALGRKTYFWGRTMAAKNTPIQVIRSYMRQLHDHLRVSVNLFTCIDQRMFCLESFMDSQSPALWQAGKSLPMHISILGAVFFLPEDTLQDDGFLRQEIEAHEKDLDLEQLKAMIEQVRTAGFQDDQGIFFPGMRRLAVPLREGGQVNMSLGLGIMPMRLEQDSKLYDRLVAQLQSAQYEIEAFIN